jgi:hypothetical protein
MGENGERKVKPKIKQRAKLAAIAVGCIFVLAFADETKEYKNGGDEYFLIKGGYMGHMATGRVDTVKAEIVVNRDGALRVIDGFIEQEKYAYYGDRMPNGLPNNGGVYDSYYVTKRFLYSDKTEVKEFVWNSRALPDSTR